MTPQSEARIRAAFAALAIELIDALDADEAAVEPERLLSIPDAAAALGGIARSTVYREIQAGRLRSVRVGSRRLVPSSAIGAYVKDAA